MRCQLCGHEFETTGLACHAECPMGSHCNLICCPNCGYQAVDDTKSSLANFFRWLWPAAGKAARKGRTHKRPAASLVPLTHVPEGKKVEVGATDGMPPSRLTKLSVFGLVPGGYVEVLQRRPAPIIRVDQTELTLSEDILEQIWVRV